MAILAEDIKIMKSEVMLDTSDGGGKITATEVVDGVSNNMFPDVSELDRTYGRVALRKVFSIVNTNNVESYLGAHAIITRAPADPNVSCLLFTTANWTDVRTAAQSRIESYLARGPRLQGQLHGTQLTGQRSVTMLFKLGRKYPDVGDTLVLIENEGLVTEYSQYVRIILREVVEQSFTVSVGSGVVTFSANVCTYDISDPLRYDFHGPDPQYYDTSTGVLAWARATVVANAATYYGIQPLEDAIEVGDLTCKVPSIFAHIVPSTQTEVAVLDEPAVATAAVYVKSSAVPESYTTGTAVGPGAPLFAPGPIHPGTWQMTVGATTLTDAGRDVFNGVTKVGTIDHTTGRVDFLSTAPTYTGTKTMTHETGGAAPAPRFTHSTEVTIGTRGYVYNYTFPYAVNPFGITVSYMAQGEWYDLNDDGNGSLAGTESSLGTGTINYTTGTVSVTLGALPDVGSEIIFYSTQSIFTYSPLGGSTKDVDPYVLIQAPTDKLIVQGSVVITWTDGGAKTCTDDGEGNLTGDGSGEVNYKNGQIRLVFDSRPAAGTTINYDFNVADSTGATQTDVDIDFVSDGVWEIDTGMTNIQPGSVKIWFPINIWASVPPLTGPGLNIDPRDYKIIGKVFNTPTNLNPYPGAPRPFPDTDFMVINDDGNGGFVGTAMYGASGTPGPSGVVPLPITINYLTGMIDITSTSLLAPGDTLKTIMWFAKYNGVSNAVATGTYPNLQWTYIRNTFNFPVAGDPTCQATIEARGATSDTAFSDSFTLGYMKIPAAGIDGVDAGDGVLPGTIRFTLGSTSYYEANGTLYKTFLAASGAGTSVGTVDIATGVCTIAEWPTGSGKATIKSVGAYSSSLTEAQAKFRIPSAPVKSGSFQVHTVFGGTVLTQYLPMLSSYSHTETTSLLGPDYQRFTITADTITAVADTNGDIITAPQTPGPGEILVYPAVTGYVNYVTGVVNLNVTVRVAGYTAPELAALDAAYPSIINADDELEFPLAVKLENFLYNAVTFTYIPLSADLLGLDPVRLPQDGKVPIFLPGQVIVVHNTEVDAFPSGASGSPSGSGASATAVRTGTAVTSVTSLVGGTGYVQNCPLTFTGGGGTGAKGYGVQTAGVITSVVITAGGTGYTSDPTIAFVPTGRQLNCGRTRLAYTRVYDSDDPPTKVDDADYTVDLDLGIVELQAAYDAGDYVEPILVEHRIEDMVLCSDVQITGDLQFTRQFSHDFPADTSYVSSALIIQDQQARVTNRFDQISWTNVWSDSLIGSASLASYNGAVYPITTKNKDCIQERWAIIFTDANNFRVVGEAVGQIATGNITTNLAPNNPNTGAPYFSLNKDGWGSGWVSGNTLRFNTIAANYPIWCIRTVQQGAALAAEDSFQMQVRGDVDAP